MLISKLRKMFPSWKITWCLRHHANHHTKEGSQASSSTLRSEKCIYTHCIYTVYIYCVYILYIYIYCYIYTILYIYNIHCIYIYTYTLYIYIYIYLETCETYKGRQGMKIKPRTCTWSIMESAGTHHKNPHQHGEKKSQCDRKKYMKFPSKRGDTPANFYRCRIERSWQVWDLSKWIETAV